MPDGNQINGLMDLMDDTSKFGVVSPQGVPDPQTYSLGPTGGGQFPIYYSPEGQYTGTPMQLASEYSPGSSYGPWSPTGAGGGSFNLGRDWRQYASNDISTGGGFFSIQDLFDRRALQPERQFDPQLGQFDRYDRSAGQRRPPQSSAGPGGSTPWSFQFMQDQPSTNNWRLMPPQWRHPGFIMRNGIPINTDPSAPEYAPGVPVFGSGGTDAAPTRNILHSGASRGFPSIAAFGGPASGLWPGQLIGGWGLDQGITG